MITKLIPLSVTFETFLVCATDNTPLQLEWTIGQYANLKLFCHACGNTIFVNASLDVRPTHPSERNQVRKLKTSQGG